MSAVFDSELGVVEDGNFGCYCEVVVLCRELSVV
jgi:hypothetical protein